MIGVGDVADATYGNAAVLAASRMNSRRRMRPSRTTPSSLGSSDHSQLASTSGLDGLRGRLRVKTRRTQRESIWLRAKRPRSLAIGA